jgi:hypothetical protein
MEGDPTPQTPAPEAAPAADTSPAAASASPAPDRPQPSPFDMDGMIRGMAGRASSASTPAGVVPTSELTEDGDDRPAEHGEESSAAPAPGQGTGRRSKAAQQAAERIAELERQVAERDPERIRQQIAAEDAQRAEQAAIAASAEADAERYRRLTDTLDDDLSPEDYNWREEQKDLLKRYPQVRKLADGLVETERRTLREQASRQQDAFWGDVRSQIARTSGLPHVEIETLKAAPTWDRMAEHLHAAGAAWKEAEYAPQLSERDEKIARLEADVADLRRFGPRGLANAAAPFSGGTSGGPGTPFDMDALIRGAAGIRS